MIRRVNMPFELIRRKEGEMSQKQKVRRKNVQISINNWGHLVVREFDEPEWKTDCEIGDEYLIVFDNITTKKIIDFIFSIRSTYEFENMLKNLINNKGELPF
jgi:hypothetical protein